VIGCISSILAGSGEVPVTTKIILSSHNFNATPSADELKDLARWVPFKRD
jgi:3-dehydroquinate dehydratase